MDLWIVSQNKKTFIKTEYLEVISGSAFYSKDTWQYDKYMIINNTEQDKYVILGFYKSEKRALEVLSDIQDLIRSLCDSEFKIIQYEMPVE